MNKQTVAKLQLTARQYYYLLPLFWEKDGSISPLVKSIGNSDFMINFLSNEDMWAAVELLREAKLWYLESATWKYAKEGI